MVSVFAIINNSLTRVNTRRNAPLVHVLLVLMSPSVRENCRRDSTHLLWQQEKIEHGHSWIYELLDTMKREVIVSEWPYVLMG